MISVKLSGNTVIPCPLRGFALRRARKCLECEHYSGLARATSGGAEIEGSDADKFMVICSKPITRRMQIIEDD